MFYHYPLLIRFWHLLNALFFLILLLTGLSMYFSGPDDPLISFATSVRLHNICGIGLSLNYLIFLIGNRLSGNGKNYRLNSKGFVSGIIKQFRYFMIGYFSKQKNPFPVTEDRKFNPLQALSYLIAMYVGVPLLILTGCLLLFPELLPEWKSGISGLMLSGIIHIITGFLLTVFLLVHIYMCTLGTKPGNNFRAILTGWQTVEKE